jgi:hypothetical protein
MSCTTVLCWSCRALPQSLGTLLFCQMTKISITHIVVVFANTYCLSSYIRFMHMHFGAYKHVIYMVNMLSVCARGRKWLPGHEVSRAPNPFAQTRDFIFKQDLFGNKGTQIYQHATFTFPMSEKSAKKHTSEKSSAQRVHTTVCLCKKRYANCVNLQLFISNASRVWRVHTRVQYEWRGRSAACDRRCATTCTLVQQAAY